MEVEKLAVEDPSIPLHPFKQDPVWVMPPKHGVHLSPGRAGRNLALLQLPLCTQPADDKARQMPNSPECAIE